MKRSWIRLLWEGHPIARPTCALLVVVLASPVFSQEADTLPEASPLSVLGDSVKDISFFESGTNQGLVETTLDANGDEIVTIVPAKKDKAKAKAARKASGTAKGKSTPSVATGSDSSSNSGIDPSGSPDSAFSGGPRVGEQSSLGPNFGVGASSGFGVNDGTSLSASAGGNTKTGVTPSALDQAIASLGANSQDLADSLDRVGAQAGVPSLEERRRKDPSAGVVSPFDLSPKMKIGYSKDTVPIFANPTTGRSSGGNPSLSDDGVPRYNKGNAVDGSNDAQATTSDTQKAQQADDELTKVFDDPPVKINIDNYNKAAALIEVDPERAKQFGERFSLFNDTVRELEQKFGQNDSPERRQKVLDYLSPGGDAGGFVAGAQSNLALPVPDAMSQPGGASASGGAAGVHPSFTQPTSGRPVGVLNPVGH